MCSAKNFNKSRRLEIGGKGKTKKLAIGGGAPISIQTMWKDSLNMENVKTVAEKMEELAKLGCDLVRFAVPNEDTAHSLVHLSTLTSMPLVADIHFDSSLALLCMAGNVAKVRINPGNIGSKKNVEEVVRKAQGEGVALRIGLNSGSLPKDLRKKLQKKKESAKMDGLAMLQANREELCQLKASLMAEAAFRELELLDELNFTDVLVSIKSSSVRETILANELFRKKRCEPIHLGVTEAGPLISGVVKSTIAFSTLLNEGIGDTIRVSLSDSLQNEVLAAREVLAECGLRTSSVRIVSCPRCGRRGFDVHSFVKRWEHRLFAIKKEVSVAIMGCVVNGPGEASQADLGITGSPNNVVLFRKGKLVKSINLEGLSGENKELVMDEVFEKELSKL